jgi:hypothetical protein
MIWAKFSCELTDRKEPSPARSSRLRFASARQATGEAHEIGGRCTQGGPPAFAGSFGGASVPHLPRAIRNRSFTCSGAHHEQLTNKETRGFPATAKRTGLGVFKSVAVGMRAERAKLKSRRDDLIIAQGKRSAALGDGRKMISSFFPSGLARRRRAKPEGKKEAGWGGSLPNAGTAFLFYQRPWPGEQVSILTIKTKMETLGGNVQMNGNSRRKCANGQD